MNLGLGNRVTLRKFILPGALATSSSELASDAAIDALGLGVAGLFEKFCDRRFGRVVDDVAKFSADRLTFVLPRYPLEGIATVERRARPGEAWEGLIVGDVLAGVDEPAGLLRFAAPPGDQFAQLRVTYTGGYWFDATENASGQAPNGAALLPPDLALAWLTCCQDFWIKRDKLGLSLGANPGANHAVATTELTTGIKAMLAAYRRHQMS